MVQMRCSPNPGPNTGKYHVRTGAQQIPKPRHFRRGDSLKVSKNLERTQRQGLQILPRYRNWLCLRMKWTSKRLEGRGPDVLVANSMYSFSRLGCRVARWNADAAKMPWMRNGRLNINLWTGAFILLQICLHGRKFDKLKSYSDAAIRGRRYADPCKQDSMRVQVLVWMLTQAGEPRLPGNSGSRLMAQQ